MLVTPPRPPPKCPQSSSCCIRSTSCSLCIFMNVCRSTSMRVNRSIASWYKRSNTFSCELFTTQFSCSPSRFRIAIAPSRAFFGSASRFSICICSSCSAACSRSISSFSRLISRSLAAIMASSSCSRPLLCRRTSSAEFSSISFRIRSISAAISARTFSSASFRLSASEPPAPFPFRRAFDISIFMAIRSISATASSAFLRSLSSAHSSSAFFCSASFRLWCMELITARISSIFVRYCLNVCPGFGSIFPTALRSCVSCLASGLFSPPVLTWAELPSVFLFASSSSFSFCISAMSRSCCFCSFSRSRSSLRRASSASLASTASSSASNRFNSSCSWASSAEIAAICSFSDVISASISSHACDSCMISPGSAPSFLRSSRCALCRSSCLVRISSFFATISFAATCRLKVILQPWMLCSMRVTAADCSFFLLSFAKLFIPAEMFSSSVAYAFASSSNSFTFSSSSRSRAVGPAFFSFSASAAICRRLLRLSLSTGSPSSSAIRNRSSFSFSSTTSATKCFRFSFR
mmetsp:Transcript_13868/g.34241  ORF Transcript_13868/g.34241 Transcript_13868/m.34241 type:complete len:523 (-) Transcript_13868:1293-2861(-)